MKQYLLAVALVKVGKRVKYDDASKVKGHCNVVYDKSV